MTSTLLEPSTEHQPRARLALSAALESGPSHAYLFRGPRGSGKRAAARAFAAEIIAGAAADPEEARRRAMLDPSPHPDLVWLAPRGAQHLVEEVRERVIRAAAYRPFEGGRRVFVIEAAEAMRDESQNALLKTLEEPPPFAHMILLCAEPSGLLETIASRCQAVDFSPLPAEAIAASLEGDSAEIAAAARLAAGDLELARFLLGGEGRALRDRVSSRADWRPLLKAAEEAGEEAEASARAALDEQREAGIKRSAREVSEEAKRAGRRRRTELLDLALSLTAAWFRDLAAMAVGAGEVVYNSDRADQLRRQADEIDAGSARQAVELVEDSRRRLDLNVSEELALEALFFRLDRLLA
jgi:DNA polymerase-3 subunit delta'